MFKLLKKLFRLKQSDPADISDDIEVSPEGLAATLRALADQHDILLARSMRFADERLKIAQALAAVAADALPAWTVSVVETRPTTSEVAGKTELTLTKDGAEPFSIRVFAASRERSLDEVNSLASFIAANRK